MRLKSLGPCGATCCETIQAPAEEQQDCPWDVLTVYHDENFLRLRRCTSVSTPLLSPVGTYDTGESIPFYQPDGVGPPLGASGLYQISADRRQASAAGLSAFNDPDCLDESGVEGAFATEVNEVCYPSPFYDPGGDGTRDWTAFREGSPSGLRVTQPDESGQTWAIYWAVSQGNGETNNSPGFKYAAFNLDTGEAWTFIQTLDADVALALVNNRNLLPSGQGSRVAVAKNKLIYAGEWNHSTKTVAFLKTEFNLASVKGAWIEPDDTGTISADYSTNRATVAYQLDDARYTLDIKSGPGDTTRVWSVDPQGRSTLLTTRAPTHGHPFCYQRKGGRHVFLWDNREFANGTQALGYLYFNIEECRIGSCDAGTTYGTGVTLADEGYSPAYYIAIGARDQVMLVTSSEVVCGDWSMAVDQTFASASISQTSWYGWIHVRGCRIDTDLDMMLPVIVAPEQTPDSTQRAGSFRSESQVFSIHPDGPDSGLTIARQHPADVQSGGLGTDGTELMQFVGEKWVGEYDTASQRVLKYIPPFYGLFSDLTHTACYGNGVSAAPMPANYGPGASASY